MIETKTVATIPAQLRNSDFGFVKLGKKSKKPFEKDWQNKPYTYEDIQPWIDEGGNYGVQGGYGDLIVIDADTEEIDKVVRGKLPATFTVKTPRCGHHYYYICKGFGNKVVLSKGDEHFGEIISSGSQVVGAGSIHPDTGTMYEVANDIEIAEISRDDILTNLTEFIPSKSPFEELVEKHGDPYYLKKGELTGINESFWAALLDAECIQLYEPTEKCFYRYDDLTGLYKDISVDVIKQEISRRMLEISRENNIDALQRRRSMAALNNIAGHLRGICEKRNAFDRSKRKIVHLLNGVLEFKSDNEADLLGFSPEFYSRNQSPIPYDAAAQCPRFLNELLYPATSPDDAILIQKNAGLALLGNNLIQRVLVFDGGAGRGKTTISLLFQKLVGSDNVTELRTSHLAERFEVYRYLKKTMLVGVDVPGDFLSKRGAYVLKALVGGDILDAEQKGGAGNFPLQGNFCVVITSNSRLQVRLDGDIGAWRRRLQIVRFEGPVPVKKVPHFEDVLISEEGSGILNWALLGLQMVFDDIRRHGDIQLTADQSGVVDALLAESDSLRHCLNDCVVSDEDGDLSVSEIEEAYAEYCSSRKWHPKPNTIVRTDLEQLMLELFQTAKSNSISRHGKSAKGYRKVKLKP